MDSSPSMENWKTRTMSNDDIKAVIDGLKVDALRPEQRPHADQIDEMIREWADVLRERKCLETEYYIHDRPSKIFERAEKRAQKRQKSKSTREAQE